MRDQLLEEREREEKESEETMKMVPGFVKYLPPAPSWGTGIRYLHKWSGT
jgi:hypothetical protein